MWKVKKFGFNLLHLDVYKFGIRYKSLGPNPKVQINDVYNINIKSNTQDEKTKNTLNVFEKTIGIPILEPQAVKVPESCDIIETKTKKLNTLSFDEVPGPQFLRYISNIWKYIPAAGPQFKIHDKVKLLSFLFDEYGPVVRVTGPLGGDIVLLSRPDDMQNVFNHEGPLPIRSAFDSLDYYRLKYRNFEFSGLYSMQGEEWNRQRNDFNISLSASLLNANEKVKISCDKFIAIIKKSRNSQDEVALDFQQNLFKWSLECMGHILFNESLGLLEDHALPKETGLHLEESLSKVSQSLAACESGLQLWKLLETPHWKQLVENCNTLESLVGQYIKQQELNLHKKEVKKSEEGKSSDLNYSSSHDMSNGNESLSLIHVLLENKKMKPDDILTTFIDMLIIGVNSTLSAMSFILYHLARGQRVQKKLFDELKSVEFLDPISTISQLKKLPYLQASVKESLRLIPPFPVITRILQKSITIDGYRIPRGCNVLMATQVMGVQEKNFDNAKQYYPERWLHPDAKDFHPLATLPFGNGPRKCIGENLSEMMILVLTAEIVRNFRIEYHYRDINPVTKLVSLPNSPLLFRFIERE